MYRMAPIILCSYINYSFKLFPKQFKFSWGVLVLLVSQDYFVVDMFLGGMGEPVFSVSG